MCTLNVHLEVRAREGTPSAHLSLSKPAEFAVSESVETSLPRTLVAVGDGDCFLSSLLAAKLSGVPAQEKPEHRSFGRSFDAPAGSQPNAEKKGIAQNPPRGFFPI